jgi:hypothetical protein
MSMVRFGLLFPEVAARETRTAKVFDALPESNPRHLPIDEYGFDELYCDERGCDCRRVMVIVLARHAREQVATINHAFDEPAKDDLLPRQTFLDPMNCQSPWATALLDLFINVLLADEAYRQRLEMHYRMFKNVVEDPTHPAHRLLHIPGFATQARGRSIPPPQRGGKRKRWR